MEPIAAKTIKKQKVRKWLAQLMERVQVIAPVAGHGGDVIFSNVSSPDDVIHEFGNTLHPAKQFVLPQTDPLLKIGRTDRSFHLEPLHDSRRRLLFNIRSCDVRGIGFLTRMHSLEPADDAYLARASNTLLVSLACNTPCAQCFCVCTDSGPFLREGYDLQMVDLGQHLLVEPGSDKGMKLLEEDEALFDTANEQDLQQRQHLEDSARKRFGAETCHFASAMRRISTRRVEDALWEKMSDWCLECGGCNMICPTCYCFSVKDRAEGSSWVRCRTWDSCQYPAFTLEATGHNPRERRKDRMKRRFFHKVSAQYFVRDGMIGCVGCGRCIKVCLGATDMPTVVAAIRRGVWNV